MRTIKLTQGKIALVDDSDYEIVNQFKWYARRGYDTFYASCDAVTERHMHRFILGLSKTDPEVDHINGNGLDNTRKNLRLATSTQNKANRPKAVGKSSIYKGVCWDKNRQKWLATITIDYKLKYLGRFDLEIDAALAYNKAAIEQFGEFAQLNIMEEL